MEPNKFDNHIKNVLEERSIKPSVNAWSTLESKLDKAEKKKKAPWFFISGIAATLIGVLLMVNLSKNNIDDQTLVDIETPTKTEVKVNENENATNITEVTVTDAISEVSTKPNEIITEAEKALNVNQNKAKRLYTNVNSVNKKINIPQIKNDNQVEVTSINEKEEKELIKNAEIDHLLSDAMLTVKSTETKTIDAESLLYDVEVEVEQTFRTRMFAKVKEGAISLKTAFVQRNK